MRNDDGTITIPVRVEEDGILATFPMRIGPDNPEYAEWDEYLKRQESDDHKSSREGDQ